VADAREQDQAMEKLLKRGLRGDLDTSGQQCPDANVLATYFDRELNADETRRWELHFSSCANCQEQLAALARTEPLVAAKARATPGLLGRFWKGRWLAPLATAAAVWALWIAVRPTIPPLEPTLPPEPPVATATRSGGEESGESQPAEATRVPAKQVPQAEKEQLTRSDRAISATASRGGRSEATAQAKLNERFRQKASSELADKRVEADEIAPTAAAVHAPPARDQVEAKREAQEEQARVAMAQEAEKVSAVPAPPPEQPGLKKEQALAAAAPADAQEQPAPGLAAAGPVSPRRAKVQGLRSEDRLASSLSRELRIATPDNAVVWRFREPHILENSRDGGQSWTVRKDDVQQPLLAGACPLEKVCWMVGLHGFVLRTTDGENWKQISAPTQAPLLAVEARDADHATVTAADGKRYVTSDGGRTWKPL